MNLTQREKILEDTAKVLLEMAAGIERAEGNSAEIVAVQNKCRYAFRLGQASAYRFASETITETLTDPSLRVVQ